MSFFYYMRSGSDEHNASKMSFATRGLEPQQGIPHCSAEGNVRPRICDVTELVGSKCKLQLFSAISQLRDLAEEQHPQALCNNFVMQLSRRLSLTALFIHKTF